MEKEIKKRPKKTLNLEGAKTVDKPIDLDKLKKNGWTISNQRN